MNRSVLLAITAAVALVCVAACSSNSSFLCAGDCNAADGGVVSVDQLISADNQADATTACYQALTTLAGTSCTSSNSTCGCATQ